MTNHYIPVANFASQPPLSSSGKAWQLHFGKGSANRTVWIPVSHSSFDNGVLSIAEWLLSKDIGHVIKAGYELKDGQLVIVPPSNVSIVPRTATPAATLQDSTGLPAVASYTPYVPFKFQPAIIKKGFFTVVDPDTGEWRTFRIKTSPRGQQHTVIGMLTGSNNISDYTWFAFISGGDLKFFGKNHFDRTKMQNRFEVIKGDPTAAGKAYALESKRCCRCSKELTTPASITNPRGLGPVCDQMLNPFV